MKQRFSERNGLASAREILSPEIVNSQFRKAIFNVLYSNFFSSIGLRYTWPEVSVRYQKEIEEKTLDEVENNNFQYEVEWLKDRVLRGWELYELLDYLELILEAKTVEESFLIGIAEVFKHHQIKYSVDIDNKIIMPASSEVETEALSEAFNDTIEYPASNNHFQEAIHKFSQGKYSKSIAESVHAVESLIRSLTGDDKIEIPEGLKKLSQQSPIHGAFSGAITKLYAYSGDVPGARHSAISVDESASKEEAHFVLVTSAAFLTYLTDTFSVKEQNIAA